MFDNISPSKEVVCNCKWHCLKCAVCGRVIGNDQHSKGNDCTTQFEAGAKIECNHFGWNRFLMVSTHICTKIAPFLNPRKRQSVFRKIQVLILRIEAQE